MAIRERMGGLWKMRPFLCNWMRNGISSRIDTGFLSRFGRLIVDTTERLIAWLVRLVEWSHLVMVCIVIFLISIFAINYLKAIWVGDILRNHTFYHLWLRACFIQDQPRRISPLSCI